MQIDTGPTKRFYRIAESGLCIGCGLCQSLAGSERIRMRLTPEGTERPIVDGTLDDAIVDRIYDVCPGTRIEGLPDELVNEETRQDPVWGPYLHVVRAHATDPGIRFRASTGGVLTALGLYLVETGRVEFVLHAGPSSQNPSGGEFRVSNDRQGVLGGMGSRYGPTAPLVQFCELLEGGRPFAFIGKPCDVAAIRNLARDDERVDRLCRYKLVMVCGGFAEPTALRRFLAELQLDIKDLARLDYRGNGCPGPTRIELKDARVVNKNYLDLWGDGEASWGLPFRCKVCPDGIGEAADVAAADTWPGGSPSREGQEEDPGTNAVIARTRHGLELLKAAAAAGYLTFERDVTLREMDDYQPHQVNKKRAVWARYVGLKTADQLVPEVAGLRIEELAREAGIAANLREARGTRRRAREGRTREPTPRPAESAD